MSGRRPRQLNPAFASAHGIAHQGSSNRQQKQRQQQSSSSSTSRRPVATKRSGVGSGSGSGSGGRSNNNNNKVDAALRTARSTGRLNLSSCSLSSLPDAMFDLRSNIAIDLSMDSSANPGSWQSHGEEEVTTLDLSDNSLSGDHRKLDERLAKFISLKILRAKRSNIAEMPWITAMTSLDNLLTLDVSGNDLTGAMLEYLPMTVREVDLSKNNLVRLVENNASLSSSSSSTPPNNDVEPRIVLPNLIRLDVSNNKLAVLPKSMEVPSLQTLIFGNNQIEELPTDLLSPKSLTSLEGPNNRLRTVPDLSRCARLTTVDLGGNKLCEVPTIHPSLIRLTLINNALPSIAGLFSNAHLDSDTFRSELVELRLRGNKLRTLDADIIRRLTNLTLLDAGQNDLKDVPHIMGYLPQLRRAPLDGNPIRVIRTPLLTDTAALKVFLRKRGAAPSGPGYLAGEDDGTATNGGSGAKASLPTNSQASSLVKSALVGTFTLDLRGKRLDALPEEIENELNSNSTNGDHGGTVGGRIKKLDVSKNSLKDLEGWLSAMPALMAVDASQNQIQSLPSCIGDIRLVELRMARNGLSSMALSSSPVCCVGSQPTPLANSLTYIDLSGNHLEWLPSGLAKLPLLSTLILTNNKMTTLSIGTQGGGESGWREGFKSLETLNLSSNKISDLADMPRFLVECCPLLRNLSLANNELSVIPPALGVLRSLASIDLRGNPQRGIRPGILDRNATEILSYLRGRVNEEELRGLEAKVAGASLPAKDPSSSAEDNTAAAEGEKRVEELKKSIEEVTMQLNNVHLTEAKKYAMKKTLRMHKAALIKEERRNRGR